MGCHANSAEVQSVGIPASLDGDVGMRPLIRMASASSVKEFELLVGQVEFSPSKIGGKVSGPRPVARISGLIDSPAVVENGEELHDLDVGARGFR